ncbi:hypothetical protein Vretimale_18290 [Volvox reticuliferus]|uniref:PAS domain-containing protein n=1 Tax=Volvox reticuliferus TaxID=1737510 RepID=A0A8J4FLZ6_9CHLO|nr:hypothetical protein Vretifemale_8692 [Volvox reticuliferus]GIM15520.1 hypothetical protein Vretimale_18290 [Volvox reticuliferus]
MERQSSFGSQGSGKSSATKLIQEAEKHGKSVENQNSNNGFTTALFGVLFTLAKEKYSDSWKVAILTVIVDFLLILAIMFNLEYPWAVDPHNGIFKFFYMLEIHKPLSTAGYKFYVIVFYLLSAMLYVSVAICVWVAWCFKNDSFPYLWPIKFVRVVASLFFGMLYIAALNIFLVIIECAPEHGVWVQHIWHKECLAMPHLVHSIFSILSCLIFAVAALLLVIADHELQPMSRSLLAAPHSMTELKAQLAKTVITVVDVLLWDFPRVQGVVFALCTGATLYFHLKQLPYYTSWMNSFRLCFFAVHAWVGLHLGVLVFVVKSHKVKKGSLGFIQWETENYETAKIITNSMLYGLPVVFFGAGLLGAIRLYYFFRVALKFQIMQQQPNMYSKRVHRFSDDKEVEVCSRIARVWDEDGNLDQQCLDLAETILRAGIQQFPKSPYLHIVYANLLIECRQQLQSGWTQLEEARRMPLNLSYRFSIFTREQEHKQKAAVSSSGESAADLVSYVEFQRNYRLIQSYHKAALLAMREFWRLLLYDAVNMNSLTSAFRKIEQMERLADKTYKMVLERYPKAVKLLRSYALFLETVKNDPWTAAQFYTEAEKQEEALENAEHDLAGEEGLTIRNSAIVTINAMGIIQMANKHAIKMLGYSKGELEGKNVSCLMPQPFSARHNTYLRNYITTGKAKILDELREVVALHRDRYVFPIKILVSKSQGNGADAIFMGLLKEVEADPNQIKAWLMPNGVTLCADLSFTDYAGWAPNDLIGKPFNSIAADPPAVDKLLEKAMKATAEDLADGYLQADIMLTHKFAEDVPVTLRVELGGTADQRLLVLNMARAGEVVPTMVLDHHGRVLFANQALCSLLGTKPKDMRGRDLGTLMPQPFGYLHHRWIKDAEMAVSTKPPPSSCRAGAVHSLVSSNGVHVPVRMIITSRELPGGVHVNIVRATRVTLDEALDEQRVNITTDQHGHIISVSSASHHNPHSSVAGAPPSIAPSAAVPLLGEMVDGSPRPQIFGYPPENLVGRKLYEAVDIFQEWHGQGHSVMHAVKALAQHSSARPGSAWRVGVLPHYLSLEMEKAAQKLDNCADGEDQTEEKRLSASGMRTDRQLSHRRSMRRNATLLRTSLPRWRAAIMQVMGPEHTATGTHYTVKLWRPELLSGVLELNEKMVVVKADSAAGLIFGVPSYTMSQQPLWRFLKLGAPGSTSLHKTSAVSAPGANGLEVRVSASNNAVAAGDGDSAQPAPLITKESLMGNHHVKGGMKGGKLAHKTGPRRIFEARHADGMPLQISFQVAMKNGTSATRLIAAIKPLNLIKGNIAVLYTAMRGEDLDHYTIEDVGSRSLHRVRTHASQRQALASAASKDFAAAAAAASGGGNATALPRRQGTGKIDGGGGAATATAFMETAAAAITTAAVDTPAPLLKVQSVLSARATGVAPGLSSARTLETSAGAGSLGMRSEDLKGVVKAALDDAGGNSSSKVDPLVIASTDSNILATARNIDLKFGAVTTPRQGSGTGKDVTAVVTGADEKAADCPGTPERDGKEGQGAKVLGSVSGSDTNGRPVSDDSAMLHAHQQQEQDKAPQPQETEQTQEEAMEGLDRKQQPKQEADQEGEKPKRRSGELQQGSEGGRQLHPHSHHHHHMLGPHLSRKFQTRDWDHVLHVDPEEVPIPHDVDYDIEHHWGDEKDMTVSSSSSSYDDDGSDSESDHHVGKNTEGAADKMTREEALQRKKTMAAMEPSERVQYVKGVRRVKEWLASGYFFDRRDAEPVDSEVHRGISASNMDPWRASASRQPSRVLEEEDAGGRAPLSPRTGLHRKHSGGGATGSGAPAAAAAPGPQDDALDPDDQLMTLDELAAEVEQQDEKSDEDDMRDRDGDGDGNKQIDDGGAGRDRGHHGKHAWDEDSRRGNGAHSRAATVGGSKARGHHKGGGGGGGIRDDVSSVTGHSAVDSSGMSRGKRLKRLLKLLSGQKVSRGVSRLRMHVLVVIGSMMLVHTLCFILVIIYINKQKLFITEISAAGEAIDRTFYTAMYTRAIEAATRSAGFSSDNIASLEARLTIDVDRLEYLHQGLYLGFSNLRRSSSSRLNNLWDLKQWNVTEYQDTKVPTTSYILMTLWNLGNDFISAVREVAFYAAAKKLLIQTGIQSTTTTLTSNINATLGSSPPPSVSVTTNVTLSTNRFWLFVRDNAGESLYTGYLRVLDTLLLLAQDNISMLKVVIIALLLVEGCLVCFAAVGYVFWLLWKATRARAALFTVFLVIPQGQLRALASRHITTAQSDDDSDDEEAAKAKQEAAERGGDGTGSVGGDDQASDGASVLSGGPASGRGARRSFTMAENPRASNSGSVTGANRKGITFKEEPKKKAQASKQSETVFERIRHAMSGEVTVPAVEKTGRTRRFFTKKRLTHTTSDIKHLAWPFFAWGIIIVVIYLVSYLQFAGVEESLVNLKMFERSTAQASRTMYYINELALEPNTTRQALLQPVVASEASWLDTVYSTTLYGGRTLVDSEKAGAHDNNMGSLFATAHHAQLLFSSTGCLRDPDLACLSENDQFYEVTRHAIDPMMRRLIQEATLLSLDDLADINHTSSRWQYMWTVAQQDLHDGVETLVDSYRSDALAAFKAQGTLHTVVFAIAWVLWALYLWLLLKPYLQISSTETKRVAEMLSQLPSELDVEGMVEESWLVVADTQLDRSGASAAKVEGKRLSVANMAISVFAAVRLASSNAARKFSGGGAASGGAQGLLKAAAVGDGSDDAGGSQKMEERKDSIASDGSQSLFGNKLKAALKGVGAKGLDIGEDEDGGGSKASCSGNGQDLKAGSKGRLGSGGLTDAPQVTIQGSSLFGPPSVRPMPGRGSKVSPEDSAREPSRPGSGGGGGGGSASISRADAKAPRAPGSGRRSNRVVPLGNSSSGQWVLPETSGSAAAAVADAVERPKSSLLALNVSTALQTVTKGGNDHAGASGAAGSDSKPASPYHFNRVMIVRNNNTQYWSEDQPWQPAAAPRWASGEGASAYSPMEPPRTRGGSTSGSGSFAMASPVVASLAAAAAGSAVAANQALLPGEVDDPQVAAARVASLVGSRVGSIHRTPPSTPPPPLLTAAADRTSGGLLQDSLSAVLNRPISPIVVPMTIEPPGGSRVGSPMAASPMRLAGAQDSRAGFTSISHLSPGTALAAAASAPGSPIGTPKSGTISLIPSPSLYRGSTDNGSRPASRLAGPAAKIDLPAPPVFNRSGSGSHATPICTSSTSLSKVASLNAAAAVAATATTMLTDVAIEEVTGEMVAGGNHVQSRPRTASAGGGSRSGSARPSLDTVALIPTSTLERHAAIASNGPAERPDLRPATGGTDSTKVALSPALERVDSPGSPSLPLIALQEPPS